MAITASKPAINIREKLAELDQPQGIKGTEVLRADTAEDVRNAIGAGGRKNLILNGDFSIWQRGVSFTADNVYTADRWKSGDGTGGSPARTASRQSFTVGQTDVPNEPTYYLRHDQTGASTNGNSSISYKVEGVRTGAGQQVTFSFYSKASSPLTYRIRIIQNFGSSGSADVTNYDTNHSIGTTWTKTTLTTTLPSMSGKTIAGGDDTLNINIECKSTSTYTFDLAQVQLEVGSVATEFEHRSYGEELALCQRYYEKVIGTNGTAGTYLSSHEYIAGSNCRLHVPFKVTKRSTPTITHGSWTDGSPSTQGVTNNGVDFYHSAYFRMYVGSAGYINANAEL